MRKSIAAFATLVATVGLMLVGATPAAAACTTVKTSKGNLTAAQVGGNVTTTLDATGCQIGVYYNAEDPGEVDGANIHGATYYGVFVDGNGGNVSVDVANSSIHNIGESPFNGAQHGVAVYYYGYNTAGTVSGTVNGNTVSEYQKGGIVVNGENAEANVTGNEVTGLGRVAFIAQNGIQFGWEATGVASRNTITGNYYTGCSHKDAAKTKCIPWVSAGMLLYDVNPAQMKHSHNIYRGNQFNLYTLPAAALR